MKKLSSVVLALATAALSGCGGGGGSPAPVTVAAADTTVPVTPTVTAAVTATPFVFPAGVPSFGTTGTTTLTFTDTSATPAFSVVNGSNSASGVTHFGSCDFLVQSTNPAAGFGQFIPGTTVVIHDCNIVAATKGQPSGTAESRSTALVLGNTASVGVPVTVNVTQGGQLTLNGNSVGTVTLIPLTGTSS